MSGRTVHRFESSSPENKSTHTKFTLQVVQFLCRDQLTGEIERLQIGVILENFTQGLAAFGTYVILGQNLEKYLNSGSYLSGSEFVYLQR